MSEHNMIKKLRLEKGWSQEQLAEISGLSVRTVQRVEGGAKPGLETLRSLASVFGVELDQLREEPTMNPTTTDQLPQQPNDKAVRRFKRHLFRYAFVMAILVFVNVMSNTSYPWVLWPAFFMGIAVAIQGAKAYGYLPSRHRD